MLNLKSLSVATFLLLLTAGSTLAQEDERRKIASVGYIEDPALQSTITEISREYLADPVQVENERGLARAIVTYVGPDMVSSGRFVPPEGFYIPEQQLEVMRQKIFPNEGCQIERLLFAQDDDFIVLLVDATDDPTEDYIRKCFLGAVLTALGEDIDGAPVKTIAEMHALIRSIVN